jgi:hypothetical protein
MFMLTHLELLPPKQLGRIVLGCSPQEVTQVFGEQLTWEEWMGGNCNHALYYPGFLFEFDTCDSRRPLPHAKLLSISCEDRHDVIFRDRPLCSWNGDQLERRLANERIDYSRHDDWIEVPDWSFEFSLGELGNCDGFYMSLTSNRI